MDESSSSCSGRFWSIIWDRTFCQTVDVETVSDPKVFLVTLHHTGKCFCSGSCWANNSTRMIFPRNRLGPLPDPPRGLHFMFWQMPKQFRKDTWSQNAPTSIWLGEKREVLNKTNRTEYIHTYMYGCTYIYIYACMHICKYFASCLHLYMYACMCIPICLIYERTYIYI